MSTERPVCAETVWSRGQAKPCKNRARVMARCEPIGQDWTPLCGMHANTDRWANYVATEYREIR